MKTNKIISVYLLLGLFISAISCKKEETKVIPIISTIEVSSVIDTSAISGGKIISDGGSFITERGVCWSTVQNPTINDNKTIDGNDTGRFVIKITGLKPNTSYYIRAYATNKVGTAYGTILNFKTNKFGEIFNPNIVYGSVVDIDGNTYKTVVIGKQTWMAQNLRTTKCNDGTVTSYYQKTTDADSITVYGRLYPYSAAHTMKICPLGWHVPNSNEWGELAEYLNTNGFAVNNAKNNDNPSKGYGYNIGKSLASCSGWQINTTDTASIGNNQSKNNKSGFSAVPSGTDYGAFAVGSSSFWWDSDSSNSNFVKFHILVSSMPGLFLYASDYDVTEASIRCVKDK